MSGGSVTWGYPMEPHFSEGKIEMLTNLKRLCFLVPCLVFSPFQSFAAYISVSNDNAFASVRDADAGHPDTVIAGHRQ